jgi:hypothetical protein
MPTTVTEASPDPSGRERYLWRATAGQGHRAGWAFSEVEAQRKADAALRYLHAVEVHSPEELLAQEEQSRIGHTIMRTKDNVVVEVPDQAVNDLLAVGYTIVVDQETIPNRTNETAGPVGMQEETKRRARTPKEAA